jgi:hypothetical protein
MKSIAFLEVDEAIELLERLKKEAIPVEVHDGKQEGGLEFKNIMVVDSYYERGCNVVEAWAAEQKVRRPEPSEPSRPKWKRMGFRVFSILLFLAAILEFVRGFNDVEAGDFKIVHTYKSGEYIGNRDLALSFGLVCGATVCFGLSMPNKKNKNE